MQITLDSAGLVGLVGFLLKVLEKGGVPTRYLPAAGVLVGVLVNLCTLYGNPSPDWGQAALGGMLLAAVAEGTQGITLQTVKAVRRGGPVSKARPISIGPAAPAEPAAPTA